MSTTTKTTKAPKTVKATATPAKQPYLRFALRPEKIAVFFERAQKKAVPITLHKADGTILTGLEAVKINEKTYRVRNGHLFNVPKHEIVRIEYVY